MSIKKNIVFITLCLITSITQAVISTFTLMISPAGDGQHPGRTTPDGAERGITRLCAERIKQKIENENVSAQVLFTHNAGQIISHDEKASLANRLNVDCYLSLFFYTSTTLSLSTYYFFNGLESQPTQSPLRFYKQHEAHLKNTTITQQWAHSIYQSILSHPTAKSFEINPPCGCALQPIKGIVAPALVFEGGLKEEGDWTYFVDPIAQAIISIITTKTRCDS
jgi:N-acetylmuramoyl-L-alanine amidase